jgi:hypothetical protein
MGRIIPYIMEFIFKMFQTTNQCLFSIEFMGHFSYQNMLLPAVASMSQWPFAPLHCSKSWATRYAQPKYAGAARDISEVEKNYIVYKIGKSIRNISVISKSSI